MMGVTSLDASIWHAFIYKRVLRRAFGLGNAAKDVAALLEPCDLRLLKFLRAKVASQVPSPSFSPRALALGACLSLSPSLSLSSSLSPSPSLNNRTCVSTRTHSNSPSHSYPHSHSVFTSALAHSHMHSRVSSHAWG